MTTKMNVTIKQTMGRIIESFQAQKRWFTEAIVATEISRLGKKATTDEIRDFLEEKLCVGEIEVIKNINDFKVYR